MKFERCFLFVHRLVGAQLVVGGRLRLGAEVPTGSADGADSTTGVRAFMSAISL